MRRGVVTNRDKSVAAFIAITGREPRDGEFADEIWLNDRYVVSVDRHDDGVIQTLSIRSSDRSARHDWRDFQRIKNDIAGAEIEAIEIYPAESRLVDTSNQYWLWCLPPGEHVPVGFFDGRVVSNNEYAQQFGAVQRDYDDESAS